MPKPKEKLMYNDIEKRVIYMLKNPLSKEFIVAHTLPGRIRKVYCKHFCGEVKKTSNIVANLKNQNSRLCMFILNEVECTPTEAYKHVIVWTKIFVELGYTPLDEGNIQLYIKDLLDENLELYNQYKSQNINEITSCKKCLFPKYKNVVCPNYSYSDEDFTYDFGEKREDEKQVSIRFSRDEYNQISENAEACGQTITGYFRNIGLKPWFVGCDYSSVEEHRKQICALRNDIHGLIYSIAKAGSFVPNELEFILQKMNEISKYQTIFVEHFLEEYETRLQEIAKNTREVVREEIERQKNIKPKKRRTTK